MGEVDHHGDTRFDDTFLVLFNSGGAKRFILPPLPYCHAWRWVWASTGDGRGRSTKLKPEADYRTKPGCITLLTSDSRGLGGTP